MKQLHRLGRHHMLVQFNHHPISILIVDLHERKDSVLGIDCTFYLASVKPVTVQDDEQTTEDAVPENEMPKSHLKVLKYAIFFLVHKNKKINLKKLVKCCFLILGCFIGGA